jgi:hypothetical protein
MVAYAVIRTARADTGDLPILRQMLRTEWQALQRLALMPHMSLSAEVTGSIIGWADTAHHHIKTGGLKNENYPLLCYQ